MSTRRIEDPRVLAVVNEAWPAIVVCDLIAVAAAMLCWRTTQRGRSLQAMVGIAAAWFLCLSVLFATVGRNDSLRSGRSLAAQIPADLVAHAPIFSVQTYNQTLPFYLQRTMLLVDWRGELDYGLRFTLHAEFEGMRLRTAFERLLLHWLEHGLQPCSMRDMYFHLSQQLPVCAVDFQEIVGRSGLVACQNSPQFSSSRSREPKTDPSMDKPH